jgi:signal transduction histidine kinase
VKGDIQATRFDCKRSPTTRLLTGLAVTLSAVTVYSGYTVEQLRALQQLQATTIDRNRTDSILLLRIQNNLNSLGLAIRDMLDGTEPYPLAAWQGQFQRIRADLQDAVRKEGQDFLSDRYADQRSYLAASVAQFWDALDRVFTLGRNGKDQDARTMTRLSLQARQEALSTAVARLLILNNEAEQEADRQTHEIYVHVERNVYVFLSAMLILIVTTSLYFVQYNRRVFRRVATASERRSELAQQLISIQENTLRSISRELHDDFGQILTAIGALLQRTDARLSNDSGSVRGDLREVQEIVQSTLDKVRSLSHALHPAVLEEIGFESALDHYLPDFEKQTGIAIRCQKDGLRRQLDRSVAIHLYRVMQEALNNIARHSKSTQAAVRLRFQPEAVVLEVEDDGVGFRSSDTQGMGLVTMRERAELVNGQIEFLGRKGGGALVRLTVPTTLENAHA